VLGLVIASDCVLTDGSAGLLTMRLIRRPPTPTVPMTGALLANHTNHTPALGLFVL